MKYLSWQIVKLVIKLSKFGTMKTNGSKVGQSSLLKVILRNITDVQLLVSENTRMSFFGLSTLKIKTELSKLGLLGSSLKKMTLAMDNLEPFHKDFNECILPKSYFVKDYLAEIASKEQKLKNLYLDHNQNVIENVPKENLLVWNVS